MNGERATGDVEAALGRAYFGIADKADKADKDANATPEQISELERDLRAHRVRYRLEWHPGALHGYLMPSRSERYNDAAAEKVWGRMRALFARHLLI